MAMGCQVWQTIANILYVNMKGRGRCVAVEGHPPCEIIFTITDRERSSQRAILGLILFICAFLFKVKSAYACLI